VRMRSRLFAPRTRQEKRRWIYVVQVDFVLLDAVPNAFISCQLAFEPDLAIPSLADELHR
jgi:hypothetical protein